MCRSDKNPQCLPISPVSILYFQDNRINFVCCSKVASVQLFIGDLTSTIDLSVEDKIGLSSCERRGKLLSSISEMSVAKCLFINETFDPRIKMCFQFIIVFYFPDFFKSNKSISPPPPPPMFSRR